MANIITELHLEMSANWYVSKKLNSIGRVGENTVTKLIIEPTEIFDNVTYEIEIADASGSKNVAELTVDGTELYLILTANMLTTSGITKMQVRGLFTDGSIKKSNIFELKVNRSISATEAYEEYAVTIFDQLVQDCRDIIEGAESYAVRAETAAVNAEAYEQSASTSAEAASASASTASTASTAAVNAAASAESASASVHTSAETATTAATSASTSASNASTSATNAANSATAAATSATNAHNSEVNASTSETNASASATEAAEAAETVASSVAQINENTYRINDLEAIIGGYQLTDLPTGTIATVADGTALLMPSLKVGIEPVQSGSGDPSPENIRPISGWTAVNVARTGKNIWGGEKLADDIVAKVPKATKDTTHKTVTYGAGNVDKIVLFNDFKENTQYSIYLSTSSAYTNAYIIYTDGIPDPISPNAYKVTYANKSVDKIIGWWSSGNTVLNYEECGVFEGVVTAETFSPYNGTTYNVQFTDGDNPLTVYGGTLDVTTGELVVDRVYKEFDGTENWTRYATSENNTSFNLYSSISNATSYNRQISNQLNFNIQAYDVTSDRKYTFAVEPTNARRVFIQVPTSVASTNEAFKTWLATQKANNTPVAISVKITPTTYHLTPTQVRTLVGNNNIWADTGDIIEGKYYRSPF